ncbi:2-hydroxyacid dehydrogenase [Sporomusa aerivorans]|uniref:2-hydroxyacid dehydrogenase n=1 Tax=Sporomusa aerivorans TaxID=204936 RepID=UPI00352A26D7
MTVVISAMPRWRFAASQVAVPEDWDVRFINPSTDEELILACQEAEFLLVPASVPEINAHVLRNITHIKLIQSVGAGFDRIDTQAAAALHIPVANVPGTNAKAVAEFTIGLIIALKRRLLLADREVKAGRYQEIREVLFTRGLSEIEGSKAGVIGLGSIGRQVAKILTILGANVSYYSRRRQPPEIEAECQVSYKPLEALLAQSDVVSLHVPLNAATRGLIGQRELALMSSGSILINTARGEIVDQAALTQVLEAGRISGAAIDVFAPEPPAPVNPLLSLSPAAKDRLLVTPHIGGVTVEAMRKMLLASLDNIARAINGQPPVNIVNL